MIILHLLMLTMGEPSVRSYSVAVEGVGTGVYSQSFTDQGDGAIEVLSSSTLRAKKFLVSYSYDFTCTEVWKRGSLVSAVGRKNDNGAILDFKAEAGSCEWVSSFWTLPEKRIGTIRVFDLDTGKVVNCSLAFVGIDKTGRHWKVSGGIEADLWYDQNGRMIQRMMLRKGRQATVTLTGKS